MSEKISKPKVRFQGIAPVSNGQQRNRPPSTSVGGGLPATPLAHRRQGYPSSGCSLAEPDSVSPGLPTASVTVGATKAKSKQSR